MRPSQKKHWSQSPGHVQQSKERCPQVQPLWLATEMLNEGSCIGLWKGDSPKSFKSKGLHVTWDGMGVGRWGRKTLGLRKWSLLCLAWLNSGQQRAKDSGNAFCGLASDAHLHNITKRALGVCQSIQHSNSLKTEWVCGVVREFDKTKLNLEMGWVQLQATKKRRGESCS